jgi:hypothetical protein
MKTKVKIEDKLDKMVMETINRLFPEFSKLIEDEVKKVYDNAYKNWLVRKTENQHGFFKNKRSKDSKNKLKFDVKIQGGKIVGSVSNLAPYAYAIKVGPKSDTILPLGKRIADELITKPMKKMSKKLNDKLVDEFIKLQG